MHTRGSPPDPPAPPRPARWSGSPRGPSRRRKGEGSRRPPAGSLFLQRPRSPRHDATWRCPEPPGVSRTTTTPATHPQPALSLVWRFPGMPAPGSRSGRRRDWPNRSPRADSTSPCDRSGRRARHRRASPAARRSRTAPPPPATRSAARATALRTAAGSHRGRASSSSRYARPQRRCRPAEAPDDQHPRRSTAPRRRSERARPMPPPTGDVRVASRSRVVRSIRFERARSTAGS